MVRRSRARMVVGLAGLLVAVLVGWWWSQPAPPHRTALSRPVARVPTPIVPRDAPSGFPPGPSDTPSPSGVAAAAPATFTFNPDDISSQFTHSGEMFHVPETPVSGSALHDAAEGALSNAVPWMCALQYALGTNEAVDDDLDLDVVIDENGLAEATLVGAEEVPASLAGCYAESLWNVDWPKSADGPQTMTLRLVAGVAPPPGEVSFRPTGAAGGP